MPTRAEWKKYGPLAEEFLQIDQKKASGSDRFEEGILCEFVTFLKSKGWKAPK